MFCTMNTPSDQTSRLHRPCGAVLAPLALAAFLTACSTPPSPPVASSEPAQNAAQATPPAKASQVAEPGKYSPAVAAHFPDPDVRYSTPGLQPERQGFTSNDEARDFLQEAAAQAGKGIKAEVKTIGQSQKGADIHALLLSRGTVLAPGKTSARPTVLLVGQQHGNEPAAGEAMLVAAQKLASGQWQGVLDRVNVIIVPYANPDGSAAGKRDLANGIDLNRDHLLLNTPEAQTLAKLVRDYRPLVVVDSHEYTVGGRFQQKFQAVQAYDGMTQYATVPNLGAPLVDASRQWFVEPLFDAWQNAGLSAQWYFTTSTNMEDMGLAMGGIRPDTGRNVNGLKNTISLLIETRGIGIGRTHIQRRVHTQVLAIDTLLQQASKHASALQQRRKKAEQATIAQACRGNMIIDAEQTPQQRDIAMFDPVTGEKTVRSMPWKSSLTLKPTLERSRPCGYLLAASESDAVERLRLLGVKVQRVVREGQVQGEAYQETERTAGARQDVRGSIGGANEIWRIKTRLEPRKLDVAAGSYYVSMAQPLAPLAAAALEPDTQNSYFANRIQAELANLTRVTEPPRLRLQGLSD